VVESPVTLAQLPSAIAALAVLVLGVIVAVKPDAVERVGVRAVTPLGRTELRAVFGGMFVAMGAACLVTANPYAYLTAGAMWLGDAFVRVFAIFADRPKPAEGLAVLATGAAIGALLLSGFWTH
jgi:hypothetical protein